jgi:hypothetical protein
MGTGVPTCGGGGGARPWRELFYSPASSVQVKNEWSFTSTPLHAFVTWAETTLPSLSHRTTTSLPVDSHCCTIFKLLGCAIRR